ncbi:MAG: dTDP-4-dehydrorhamnose 3,5-epimerase family protein [Nitrospirota bacterium]
MIEGVFIKDLTTHSDERGFFREIFRFPEEFEAIGVGQLSHSLVREGVVKAWHAHKEQSQWNYVVSGRIKVALHDNRKESPTFGETMEFTIGDEEKPRAYFFPSGVLHGYKCIKGPLHIIYVTSGVYDLSDEVRIPKDDPSIGHKW